MEPNTLTGALINLPARLSVFDRRINTYSGHTSTTKGITLQTTSGSVFLYHSFIHKLVNQPELVTDEELASIATNFH